MSWNWVLLTLPVAWVWMMVMHFKQLSRRSLARHDAVTAHIDAITRIGLKLQACESMSRDDKHAFALFILAELDRIETEVKRYHAEGP